MVCVFPKALVTLSSMSARELIDLIGITAFWAVLVWSLFKARAEFSKYLINKEKNNKSKVDI